MDKSGKGRGPKGEGKTGRIGHVRRLSDLVPRVGRSSFRRFGFAESAVVARWPEIGGARLADIATPETIRFPQGKRSGGTLCLAVEGAHSLEVQHQEPEILERVNRFFGYGAVVRMSLRQVARREREELQQVHEDRGPVPHETRSALKEIGDADLRANLEALAAQIGSTKGPPKIS